MRFLRDAIPRRGGTPVVNARFARVRRARHSESALALAASTTTTLRVLSPILMKPPWVQLIVIDGSIIQHASYIEDSLASAAGRRRERNLYPARPPGGTAELAQKSSKIPR